mgnify:FL=1
MSIANLHERDRRGIRREIKQKEMVDHPTHYKPEGSKYEAIDVIEDWDLGFNDGNAVKYICRHRFKGSPVQDLEKAIWYLKRHLENIKKETE